MVAVPRDSPAVESAFTDEANSSTIQPRRGVVASEAQLEGVSGALSEILCNTTGETWCGRVMSGTLVDLRFGEFSCIGLDCDEHRSRNTLCTSEESQYLVAVPKGASAIDSEITDEANSSTIQPRHGVVASEFEGVAEVLSEVALSEVLCNLSSEQRHGRAGSGAVWVDLHFSKFSRVRELEGSPVIEGEFIDEDRCMMHAVALTRDKLEADACLHNCWQDVIVEA